MELRLPPGADGKAHPAFEIVGAGTAVMYWDEHELPIPICYLHSQECRPIIAAAIANCWREEMITHWCDSGAIFSQAEQQHKAWSAIADGKGDEYKVCKIVAYEEVK